MEYWTEKARVWLAQDCRVTGGCNIDRRDLDCLYKLLEAEATKRGNIGDAIADAWVEDVRETAPGALDSASRGRLD